MSKHRKPLTLSIGAAVVGSAALTGIASADNAFGMRDLPGGYLQLASSPTADESKNAGSTSSGDKAMEGRCGEGKCGASMRSGTKPAPAGEGDAKPAAAAAEKAMEGKCGEGRCGSSVKK